jgi:hypothetical protein
MLRFDVFKALVEEYGHRPFNSDGDNWFIVYSHRDHKYHYFTVNDRYEAPERFYMDIDTAHKITKELNRILDETVRKI